MNNKKAYIFIILGAVIAFSRFLFPKEYNQFVLIGGIFLIMAGIYTISRSLPSKNENDFSPPMVQSDEKNEKENEKA